MSFSWKGVFPAITTPFTPDDKLDFSLFEKNMSAQINAGIDGVILGGTLGESSVLTKEEKNALVKFTLEKVAGRIPVALTIAEGATRDAIAEAGSAEKLGVQALMLLPPMRYKPDHRETVTFFNEVANSTSLPIMIYNNPVDYKTLVTLEMFDELQTCKNITAVKESTRDVSNVTKMLNRFGERYQILCGVDTLALECLLMGAQGWVAGLVNAFPAETVAIYRYAKAGRIEDALKIHRWFLPLLELDLHPKLVQYIKLAATKTGIGSEYVRAPRLTLAGKEREEVLEIIENGMKTQPDLGNYLSLNF
ncbi:MAG: dihydrodipicolinate synthase family protein [Chitinophagaceae bacterium]